MVDKKEHEIAYDELYKLLDRTHKNIVDIHKAHEKAKLAARKKIVEELGTETPEFKSVDDIYKALGAYKEAFDNTRLSKEGKTKGIRKEVDYFSGAKELINLYARRTGKSEEEIHNEIKEERSIDKIVNMYTDLIRDQDISTYKSAMFDKHVGSKPHLKEAFADLLMKKDPTLKDVGKVTLLKELERYALEHFDHQHKNAYSRTSYQHNKAA